MENDKTKARFIDSLTRKNEQIRLDRANNISESAELLYRRTIEDIELQIRSTKREQESRIDISPLDTQSLTFIDFDPKEFVQRDIEYSLKIRNLTIQLEVTRERYYYLFGKKQ